MNKQDAYVLNSIAAKLLRLANLVKPDIEGAIYFLCTRLTNISMEDKANLKCVRWFLKQPRNYMRIVGADNLS